MILSAIAESIEPSEMPGETDVAAFLATGATEVTALAALPADYLPKNQPCSLSFPPPWLTD